MAHFLLLSSSFQKARTSCLMSQLDCVMRDCIHACVDEQVCAADGRKTDQFGQLVCTPVSCCGATTFGDQIRTIVEHPAT